MLPSRPQQQQLDANQNTRPRSDPALSSRTRHVEPGKSRSQWYAVEATNIDRTTARSLRSTRSRPKAENRPRNLLSSMPGEQESKAPTRKRVRRMGLRRSRYVGEPRANEPCLAHLISHPPNVGWTRSALLAIRGASGAKWSGRALPFSKHTRTSGWAPSPGLAMAITEENFARP